ncbi:MAG: amidohydrolase family protein [Gemmatimonadales bacterium]|nr:amidohydrolase family protein [Gemmatimonadales bacterium]
MAASKDHAAHPRRCAAAAAVLLAMLAATTPVEAATTPVEAATALQEILISGGTVVTSERRFDADVRVRDGTIVEIGTGLAAGAGARVIDAGGLFVMPGGVDPHVHLGGRTRDDYRTGSQAALAGGITTISNFAFHAEGQTLAEAIEREAALIREQAIADVILHAGITPRTQTGEMTTLAAETGQTSTKMFMVWTVFDAAVPDYLATMDEAGRNGILTMVHCEDWPILARAVAELTAAERTSLEYFPDSRPVVAEVVATQRAVAMAEATGAPIYAVHVSSAGALRVLQDARDRGLSVFVETRPIYLHFTRERFEGPDRGLYVGQPPLREQADQDALWAGIANGSVDVLATDHVAYRRDEKLDPSQTISQHRAGLSNLQVVRPMLYSEGVVQGRISEERFVAVTSTNAAKLFGLYPRKGTVAVGSDADIVLWDPDETRTIRDEDMFSGAGFSVYSGWEVTGWPVMTLRRGEVVYENGEILAGPGSGELLRRGRWQAP